MGAGLKVALIAAAAVSAAIIVGIAVLAKRGFSSFLLSAAQGAAAVFAVNLAGLAIGIHLAVNWYIIAAAALLGTPGVISMLMLGVIFK